MNSAEGMGYYTGKGLVWKWSELLGRGRGDRVGGAVQNTETSCEGSPAYIETGCVKAIGRVGVGR
jgi:hypothetical protein